MSDTNDLKFTIRDCDHVIRQCFQRKNIKTADFEVIPRHKDNYIFKITFEDGPQKETRCLYAKSRSKVPQIGRIFEDFGKVVPEFDGSITPKFFCGKSELLFFEDLTCQRFQNEYDSFDLKHIQKVLGVLAKIHASGFAYEGKKKKKLDEEYNLHKSNFDVKDSEDLIWGLLTHKEKVNEVLSDLEDRQISSFRRTLCHGNLQKNNILFHYNNGVPDDCKLVNFNQIYAPPVSDVLQVIYFNTNGNFRQKFLDTLIHYYYNCLEEEMGKHGLQIGDFLTFADLQSTCHKILPLIKLQTAINSPQNSESIKELKEILNESRLSREDCYVIVKNQIKSAEYELLSYHLENSKLEIKIRCSSDEKTINCFVKYSPSKLEIFFYGELFPKLDDLGIITSEHCCPCFFYRSEDVIIFEDLSLRDYQQRPSYDFTSLVTIVQLLAKFHGGSLIFEEKMSESLKKPYRLIDDYSNNFNKIIDHRFRSVLCHGSITPENIFVKDDENKIDCLFVGFGGIVYCPPAFDVLRVCQLGDDSAKSKEEELGKIYFEELGKFVSAWGYNINKFFSYQEFVESMRDVDLK